MWKCLNCKHFTHYPFIYYGGYTGFDPETISCNKDHFWIASPELEDIRKANVTGETCQDFEEM